MIRCINHQCPRRWECLRHKAAPQPGEGRMLWDHHDCPHFIADYRLANCEGGSCRL